MLALSLPPLFSTSSWTLEDVIISPQFRPQPQNDDTITNYNISGSGGGSDTLPSPSSSCPRGSHFSGDGDHDHDHPMNMISKKINHNASERDRRKRVNSLYSHLRSLLPAVDQTKKLSIPRTVSQVLKYIPQLQKQVEGLVDKKEKLLMSAEISRKEDHAVLHIKKKRKCSSTISVSRLGDREVVIQISALKGVDNNESLIEALEHLEEEINGLLLLNASSFKSVDDKIFNSFHLQVQENHKVEPEMLRQKLLLFYDKTEEQLC